MEKDLLWLPILAPQLPFAIPELLAVGTPSVEYPWAWGVYRWLDGETLSVDRLQEARHAADDLACFPDGTATDRHDGRPCGLLARRTLTSRDEAVWQSIAALGERVDPGAATAIWEAARRAPEWHEVSAWLHGDLTPGNLLFVDGRLSAIIDFSTVCVGDPACDLMVAWTFLTDRDATPAASSAQRRPRQLDGRPRLGALVGSDRASLLLGDEPNPGELRAPHPR